MSRYVGAIDQGTTSSRFIVFDRKGHVVSVAQEEHEQIFPRPGQVEHDPKEIWKKTRKVMKKALEKADLKPKDLVAIGITNQRETTLIWDRTTGEPLHNALVWQDTRNDRLVAEYAKDGGTNRFRDVTGLPLASYFSGLKLRWLLDNVKGARKKADAGEVLFGNIDTWLVWNLTGGVDGGLHITDVTNASRTQLMSLETLDWDEGMLKAFEIPRAMLPKIVSSSEVYGETKAPFEGVPIAGILGDQQAALFGQTCFTPGEAKNTYGTGCFALMNTGEKPVASKAGLVTTLAYRLDGGKPVYALEGSIAVTGSLVQWLRDNLGMIKESAEVETLAGTVEDNGGVYFVPAFSGLYAPHWNDAARGLIIGLTRYINKGHIARSVLEATAFQTKEVLEAMEKDSGIAVKELRSDGGMVANDTLMQFQADILDVPVVRPKVAETTALGAAYAAGLATGYWRDLDDLKQNWSVDHRWEPKMDAAQRKKIYAAWGRAVKRSFDWKTDAD
ncbi:glycerol kinase GlpK [Methylobacterium haplocladii]|uniref:Glycerol kinase n=1 Tax=Methylobacterium haplocladii TaxID=1176176 RepID=A0A512IJD5_9HYPH|nr:glycerol kinase GlpK [Methylobacterium haplocladii]GEO97792.1 glycerol kinase [Methylobacterium haplocladii]GJD82638.1 Glycerol kinase [Methylobacterium haplocladii]GLS57575.1 glycerol kinase [Methylobacterium haplocladii]